MPVVVSFGALWIILFFASIHKNKNKSNFFFFLNLLPFLFMLLNNLLLTPLQRLSGFSLPTLLRMRAHTCFDLAKVSRSSATRCGGWCCRCPVEVEVLITGVDSCSRQAANIHQPVARSHVKENQHVHPVNKPKVFFISVTVSACRYVSLLSNKNPTEPQGGATYSWILPWRSH